jgi:hypothetical protein
MTRQWVPAVALVGLMVWTAEAARSAASAGGPRLPASSDLYDADPHHIWNRVHRQLHVRIASGAVYGNDEVDPLLWSETKYLLTAPSHSDALAVLDEFLNTHGERSIGNLLKRAVFQHDLWAVFDWVAARTDVNPDARRALATRLARIMRRVALTKDQIDHLPDNYAAAVRSRAFPAGYDPQHPDRAFLPPGVFDANGPWLDITGSFFDPIAGQHAATFSHSEFFVLFNLPGGVQATQDYLKTLWDFPEPYVPEPFQDGEQRSPLNPALPQIPSGAQVELVRKMLLIDDAGRISRSAVTESVQLRTFHGPSTRGFLRNGRGSYSDQEFFEFRTLRRKLFDSDSGGFHAIERDEKGFLVFSAQGHDSFDQQPSVASRINVLQGCVACHSELGIQSLRILPRLLKPNPRVDYRHPRWSIYARPAPEAKARRYDWGLLEGLWQSNPW